MGIFSKLWKQERKASRGTLIVPAELWSDFGEIIYVLSNFSDSHVVRSEPASIFRYRVGFDSGTDKLIVEWAMDSESDHINMVEYLMESIEGINEHAERPIEMFDGYSPGF